MANLPEGRDAKLAGPEGRPGYRDHNPGIHKGHGGPVFFLTLTSRVKKSQTEVGDKIDKSAFATCGIDVSAERS